MPPMYSRSSNLLRGFPIRSCPNSPARSLVRLLPAERQRHIWDKELRFLGALHDNLHRTCCFAYLVLSFYLTLSTLPLVVVGIKFARSLWENWLTCCTFLHRFTMYKRVTLSILASLGLVMLPLSQGPMGRRGETRDIEVHDRDAGAMVSSAGC